MINEKARMIMKQAIIDIGSNSIRLTLYNITNNRFKILFREKIMAGLAGYMEHGALSLEGIECACNALLEFKETLQALSITKTAVFATASLRNITNTQAAVKSIRDVTGFEVHVISGEEEAQLGYAGAMRQMDIRSGAFIDIGGASTEIVTFENDKIQESVSYGVGSLMLYRTCVKNIIPGNGSMKRIEDTLIKEIDEKNALSIQRYSPLVCVGGTCRAILKMSKRLFRLPDDTTSISRAQFEELFRLLTEDEKKATSIILKLESDRIHTMIPGLMIMRHMIHLFDVDELVFSTYGAREGYLLKYILEN